jgi:transcriptional regulator with XRE-family HTH domain
MSSIRRARCPQCGARLRRGRRHGELCGPCEQVGPNPRSALPTDFYDREPIPALLTRYDFGPFFVTVRELTGWSQQTLGGVTGLDQTRISAIERGMDRLRDIELIAAVGQGLSIPPVLLNFPDIGVTVGAAGVAGRKDVSWVDRRDFGQHIAAAVLGIAGATGLDTDRLLALLPPAEPTGTRHIGAADVEIIEQLTTGFMRQDFAHGSGLIRDAAIAQLHTVLPLLQAQVSPEVRPRLMLATAYLALMAGYMSFECNQHEAARRLWMIGLDLARNTDHPQADDLTVYLLYDMALQSAQLNRPDEALHLVRIGRAAVAGKHLVSAATISCLVNVQARHPTVVGCQAAVC